MKLKSVILCVIVGLVLIASNAAFAENGESDRVEVANADIYVQMAQLIQNPRPECKKLKEIVTSSIKLNIESFSDEVQLDLTDFSDNLKNLDPSEFANCTYENNVFECLAYDDDYARQKKGTQASIHLVLNIKHNNGDIDNTPSDIMNHCGLKIDTDNDGLKDYYDHCPTESGDRDDGCPVFTDGGDWECVDTTPDDDIDDCHPDAEAETPPDDGEGDDTSTETVSDEEIPDVPFYSSADEDEFDQEMVLDTDDTSNNLDENDAVESFNSESCSLVESGQAINYVTFILFGLTLVPLMIRRKSK
ncbi:MAG: hypothetical protein ABH859_06925 [Pseudomonadota bacterium]